MTGHSARVEPNASTTCDAPAPHVLVVEDDALSAQFLCAALQQIGCGTTWQRSGKAGLAAAASTAFDLLLVDRRLPDLGAVAWLPALRSDPAAASARVPAVACSAEWDATTRRQAQQAGFVAVLEKPCSVAALQQLAEQHVAPARWPARHDAMALQAAHGASNLAALRGLLVAELRQWQARLNGPDLSGETLRDDLHRLCASAGFCGAPALSSACRQWLARLRAGEADEAARRDFEQALAEALRAFADS